MQLKCYIYRGWEPRIRVASPKRTWMDEAPKSYPYRCLPLSIANSHGWEILNPFGFEAVWNGGIAPEDVTVKGDEGCNPGSVPDAIFGQGVFTIHLNALFRTPPGWDLYVSGPPNSFKDGVSPLAGIIETDWSPYSFTMNWRLTRPDNPVRFEENEPIACIFPVQRGMVEQFEPKFALLDDEPELKETFHQWSRSRAAFNKMLREDPPEKRADRWQKSYFRGQTPDGKCPVGDHRTKLRVREFANPELAGNAVADMAKPVVAKPTSKPTIEAPSGNPGSNEAKYALILETQEQQRSLSVPASGVLRCKDLTSEQFLDAFYAPGRPVILDGEIESWPVRKLWTPEYLKEKIGSSLIEYQGERTSNVDYERCKNVHRREMPFDQFIDMIGRQDGNDAYITAVNAEANVEAFMPLQSDIGTLDKYLDQSPENSGEMLWIGPKGTFTPLHHDLTNNLLVQVSGSKRVVLASPNELRRIYSDEHFFSEIADVTDPALDLEKYPLMESIRFHETILKEGQILYIPIGWWHQVEALEFSVSVSFTNFKWKNDFHQTYPVDS